MHAYASMLHLQTVTGHLKKKPNQRTPPCLSECDKGIFPAFICKVGQRPTSCSFVQGCLFINVSTMRKLLPNLWNRELRGKVNYSSKIQCSPLEMRGWCIPSILRGEKSPFSCLHPVQMCLGCNESSQNLGVTHMHVLGGVYLHI